MVCGPEIAKAVNEFEQGTVFSKEQNSSDFRRHEETNSFQKWFCVHVHQLTEQFRKWEIHSRLKARNSF